MRRDLALLLLSATAACAAEASGPAPEYDHSRERDALFGRADDPAPPKAWTREEPTTSHLLLRSRADLEEQRAAVLERARSVVVATHDGRTDGIPGLWWHGPEDLAAMPADCGFECDSGWIDLLRACN